MKFWKLASVAIVLVLTTSANAALIDNGTYTTDTVSGLDWMDLTETTGLSYNYVFSQLESEGQFDGWRYATSEDVINLINNTGGAGPYNGFSTLNIGVVEPLLDLWGYTYATNRALAMTRDPQEFGPYEFYNSVFYLYPGTENSGDFIDLTWGARVPDVGSPAHGSALIRTASPVPAPAAVWLFGSGLIGLVGFAKRKKA